MPENVNLSSLAYLYVEKNAEKGMSAAELYAMYSAALEELKAIYASERKG